MATWEELGYRVEQAAGMVSEQADCTMDEAFVMLMEQASVQRQTLTEIVDAVLQGRIRFGL